MIKRNFGSILLFAGALAIAAPAVLEATTRPVSAAAPSAVLPSFSPLVKATQPAVVTILTTRQAGDASAIAPQIDPQMREFMERFFGRDPFGQQPGNRQHNNRAQPRGIGSGFVVDRSGYIVTNNHVIDNSDKITVVLHDGEELSATLVGKDPKTDLAVLRVDAGRGLPTVPWGNSDDVQVGDWAVAIGNPFGLGSSVTAGIVSARGRDIQSGPYDDFLQVDAPINRGNSGGPLFDQLGKVIGVNTAIFSPSGGNVGIGFAIPSNQARTIVAELIEDGSIERGWLGVSIQPVTPEIAESLGLEDAEGALIADVSENGPAEKGGLKRGDVILGFAGADIGTVKDLIRAVADTDPGTRAKVRVWRKDRTTTVAIV